MATLLGFGISSIQPALADCQPATPLSGGVVTCSGTVPTGFAPGVDQLTINILAGALVNDDGTAGFTLSFGNRVTNAGSIVTGDNTRGIMASGDDNVIVNNGTMTTGQFGTVIDVGFSSNNTITNNGAMTVGSGGTLIAAASNNTIVNTGTMRTEGEGIVVDANNRITNAGTITVIGGGTAVSFNSDNVFTNTGTLNVDCCGLGIFGLDRNTVTNSGTINLGDFALGIQLGNDNTIVNDGRIIGADGAVAMIVVDNNRVTNNGTISVTGGGAFAIQGQIANTITNNGTITVDNGGGGIFVFDDTTIVNNGLIRATNLSIAVFTPSSTNVVVTNNGTIDGGLILGACGCAGTNVLNNFGLLTITDANTPIGLPGIFTVGGTYNQSASGTLAPRVAPGAGANDSLAADTANLGGTLNVVVSPGDYAATETYQVVLATTAITGTFAQVTTSAFFDITTTYNPLDVTVTLSRRGFANGRGATINQRSVGTALDAQYVPGLTGNAATIFNAVQASTTTGVLDALSGEAATAAQNGNFAVGGHFLSLMLRQAGLARSGASGGGFARSHGGQRVPLLASAPSLADVAPAQPGGATGVLSMWMAGFGGHTSRTGDSVVGAARQSIGFGGVAVGLDYRVSPRVLIGAAVAASGSGYSVTDRAAEGDARNFHIGIYGGFASGPLYVDGALSYAYGDFTNTRTIAVGAPEQANGAFSGHQFGGRLEAGWRLNAARYEITPFAAIAVQRQRLSGYSETTRVIATGAPGILGLNVAAQRSWSVRSELGGQVSTRFTLGDGTTIKPRLRLAWAHEFSPDRALTASLQSLPTASFVVNGARGARDAALVTAGVDVGLAANVTGFAQFDGEFSLSGSSFAGAGGLRVTW